MMPSVSKTKRTLTGRNGECGMKALLLGTIGFLLYFVYDVNSVAMKNAFIQKFFALGTVLELFSFIWAGISFWKQENLYTIKNAALIAGLIIFFVLLVYTLFFALPFEETYCQESRMRQAYTEGVYSLCRHPGVLWFAGLYLCMWGITGNASGGVYFLGMIGWNLLYVIFQDLWTFPRTFSNYHIYKEKTPFLIPNGKSIQACRTYYMRDRK